MNRVFSSATILIVLVSTLPALGHGTPIQVSTEAGGLVVGGGLPDGAGFAPFVFVEDDEDGEPFAETIVPPYGPLVIWQIPGFAINGMDNDSSLSLEALLRPVAGAVPTESRTLWYWNAQTRTVEPAPSESALHLLARDSRSSTLASDDVVAPAPLLLSSAMTGQQGFHNHGLLSYTLDNEPVAPSGAYGFFARLVSGSYLPSEPFLVVLNDGIVDYEQMIPAALAINAAAINVARVPGDYDHNGTVNAADYGVWRASFGRVVPPWTPPDGNGNGTVDAADYVVWRNADSQPTAGELASTAVPEASFSALCCTALLSMVQYCRRRRLQCRGGRGHVLPILVRGECGRT